MRTRVLAIHVIVVLCAISNLSAQSGDLSILTAAPSSISVCQGAETFGVTIENLSAGDIAGIQLTVTLPGGVRYVPNSVAGGSEDDISNLGRPVFGVPGTLPAGGSVLLSYDAAAKCGAVVASSGSNQTRADHGAQFDVEVGPPTYDILSPVLRHPGATGQLP